MTPTDLRALAARVLAEEPSDELRSAVLDAIGHHVPDGAFFDMWRPNPLTSHDAAFVAMPAGWTVHLFQTRDGDWHVQLYDPSCMMRWATLNPIPSLPRALTAAGLLARAIEAEQETT